MPDTPPESPLPEGASPDSEREEFERLKPRLAALWTDGVPEDKPYTSVVIPSLSLDPAELRKLRGPSFYEERLLFLMIRLRNPRARLVYVTSQPIHDRVVDYYLHLLSGIPASHARRRLTLLAAYDSSLVPLSEKVLLRPRLMQRIRDVIPDPQQAYLTVFNSTLLERRLAVRLGIPLNAVDPELGHHGSKSGGRRVFKEAGVAFPDGVEDVRSVEDLVDGLVALRQRCPELTHAIVKLNDSFSGEGNAVFRYPEGTDREAVRDALHDLRFSAEEENSEHFLDQLSHMGGVVEERIEGIDVRSPSVQLRINPRGQVFVSSTHEQVLGGPTGQTYLGCRFPAQEYYRSDLETNAQRIAQVLAEKGVVSRFSVDFIAFRRVMGGPWTTRALEINLRMGGTTHPMFALRFLTGGRVDDKSGFHSETGVPKYYRATDDLYSEAYRGLVPDDLLEIFTLNRLAYDPVSETGILYHMIGAVSQYGKLGLVAIGNTPEQADALFERTVAVLDREAHFISPS